MLGWLRVPGCWLRSCGVIGVWLLLLLYVVAVCWLWVAFLVVGDWVVKVFDLRKRGMIVK